MKNYLFIIFFLPIAPLMGQTAKDTVKTMPGQISFVYPIGTSGTASTQYRYNFSANILVGATGGVKGFEGAGLTNSTKGSMKGFQGAGILNTVSGPVRGFQGAGIANLDGDSLFGFAGAGVLNMIRLSVRGGSTAGIVNLVGGRVDGLAAAGIANIVGDSSKGLVAAGIANLGKAHRGAAISGVVNLAKDVDGIQIAGVLNAAKRVKGMQIGLINLADTMTGVPIGLISLVRKGGYHTLELALSEPGAVQAHLILGVPQFYTMFGAMVYVAKGGGSWGPSAGVGTNLNPHGQVPIFLEARASHVNKPGEGWTDHSHEWYSLTPSLGFGTGRTKIVVGPTINLFLSGQNKDAARPAFVPYSLWTNQTPTTRLDGWIGLRAGVRF